MPDPGEGLTRQRFERLASIAATDVTAARVLEPHVDALAILAESGEAGPVDGTWGVFAAEAPGAGLDAVHDGDWRLTGTKPWCSLGGRLSDALVTARTELGHRRLFRVELSSPGVSAGANRWSATGLREVDSGPLVFEGVRAHPVGEDEWYLRRAGFAWGGIGVAACWWGACEPLAAAVLTAAGDRGDPLSLARAGRVARLLDSARLALEWAADLIDGRTEQDEPWPAVAHRVRGGVVDAVDATLDAVRDVVGPAGLAFDADLARRHADLALYAAQYHRQRDDASLGRILLEDAGHR